MSKQASDLDLVRAVQLHQSGDLGQSIRLYKKVVRKAPGNATALNLLGLASFQHGDLKTAASSVERALALKPDLPDAHYNLALIMHALRRYEDAVRYFERALAAKPDDPEALSSLGASLKEMGRYEEAVEQCRKAVALKSDYAEAHCNLGAALLALNRSAEAIEHLQRAWQLNPTLAEAHAGFGNALAARGQADEAIFHLERARALKPDDPESYFNLANALTALRRYEEALRFYGRTIELKPDHVEAHADMGWALQSLGRHDEAATAFRKALALVPEMKAYVHVSRGKVLSHLGRYDESLAEFDRAIELDPTFAEAYTQKGRTLLVLGRLDEGELCLNRAIEIAPYGIGAYFWLASLRKFEADDPRLAALENLARDPNSLTEDERTQVHAALGSAYTDLNEYARAIPHLVEASSLKRKKLPYHEKAALQFMERIRSVFCPELIRAKAGAGDPSSVPIFIVGMPRSGSTLIEQILASHPAVFGAGESEKFPYLVNDRSGGAPIRFVEALPGMSAEGLRNLGADYARGMVAEAPHAERVVDKQLWNFHYMGLIHLVLPNAKIIHSQRDPIDTCMSCFSTLFEHGNEFSYDLGTLGRYYRAYQALMEHWRLALPRDAMLDVQYETLVEDFEVQARRLIAYCGLEWDEACLAFHATERPVRTASFTQVRQPIYRASVGRWREHKELLRPLFAALEIE